VLHSKHNLLEDISLIYPQVKLQEKKAPKRRKTYHEFRRSDWNI